MVAPAPAQQAVISVNHTHVVVTGAEHIAATIARFDELGVEIADVSQDAEADWGQKVVGAQIDDHSFIAACTPSRLNFESDPSAVNPRNGNYGGSYGDYFGWRDLLAAWRENDFAGLELEGRGRRERVHEK